MGNKMPNMLQGLLFGEVAPDRDIGHGVGTPFCNVCAQVWVTFTIPSLETASSQGRGIPGSPVTRLSRWLEVVISNSHHSGQLQGLDLQKSPLCWDIYTSNLFIFRSETLSAKIFSRTALKGKHWMGHRQSKFSKAEWISGCLDP